MNNQKHIDTTLLLDQERLGNIKPLRHPKHKGSRHTIGHLIEIPQGTYLRTIGQREYIDETEVVHYYITCKKNSCGWKLEGIEVTAPLQNTQPVLEIHNGAGKKTIPKHSKKFILLDENTLSKLIALMG